MRVVIALGGIDRGRSGIGRYVRAVLPRLNEQLTHAGGTLAVLGTARDFDDCGSALGDADRIQIPSLYEAPALSALWYLFRAGREARVAGADVLLLPAANRRATWRSTLPTVAVVHDLAQFHIPHKYDALRMFYVKRVLTAALRTASELVAVSEATRKDVVWGLGCSRERVRVVYNGVDTQLFAPAERESSPVADARRAAGLSRPYLLYASRLEHPGKNHVRLLRAFAGSRLRNSHQLVLVGSDWGAGARIRADVARLGLENAVRLPGYVDDEMLAGLVAGADAVLVVGIHEGFGLPALEGLASGRPVVASQTGAALESVGEFGVPCDPGDEASLRAALERVVTDMVLRERAAAEGPAWAARWSWDETARGLLDACFSAAGIEGSASPSRSEVRDADGAAANSYGFAGTPRAEIDPRGAVAPRNSIPGSGR